MKQVVERRYVTHDVRVTGEGKDAKITGYAAVFDSPNGEDDAEARGWSEEIDPHAFDGVLSSNPDVVALWNHNPDVILGRTSSGTLRLSVDKNGLAYEVDPPDTQAARDLTALMQRGDVSRSSFGFVCKRDQWTEKRDGSVSRRILEFHRLFDVSPVTFAAYPDTSSGLRSLPASMPAEIRARFERPGYNCTQPTKGEQSDPPTVEQLRCRLAVHIGRLAADKMT